MTDNFDKRGFSSWLKYQCHKKKNVRLCLERFLAGPSWHQILAAILLLFTVFILVGFLCYGCDWGKTLADMSSPVTLRSEVYQINNVVSDTVGTVPAMVIEKKADLQKGKGAGKYIWIYLLGSIVLSGILVATITNVLRSWIDRFKQGTVSYCSFHKHTVILGYCDMVPGMIERMCKSRLYPIGIRIVVGVNKDVHEVSTQLSNQLSKKQRRCVVVLKADSCNDRDLRRLRVKKAKDVFILGEHDDAYSLNCYEKIQNLCNNRKHCPECYVQMQYQSTFALFQTYSKSHGMDYFHAFNFQNAWARHMIMRPELITRNGTVGTMPDSEKYVHLVIVGMTEMGEALAREAAFLCHYPNYVTKGVRTKITFIDMQAEEQMKYFTGRYHHLFKVCNYTFRHAGEVAGYPILDNDFLDIEFEFIQSNIADSMMRLELSQWAKDNKQLLTIAVCADMPHRSMAAGLYLPDEVFDQDIPVWVYQPTKGDMGGYLKESPRLKNSIVTFGMSGKELDIKNEEQVENAMRLKFLYDKIYEQQKRLNNKEINEQEFFDNVLNLRPNYNDQRTILSIWKNEKVFNKWSNIYCVASIESKRRCINGEWTENNVHLIDVVEHNRWNVEKLLMGFRTTTDEEHERIVVGRATKDDLKKKYYAHDNICPFDNLDDVTKMYDHKFTLEIENIAP